MKKLCLLLLLFSSCGLSTQECPDGFMPAKQTVVTPSGIVTQPNEYGQLPPGTLRVGNNICIRKTGVVEPRPAFENFGVMIGTGGAPGIFGTLKLWPIGPSMTLALTGFRSGPQSIYTIMYPDGVGNSLLATELPDSDLHPGKTQITRSRDRTFLVANSAPLVIADSLLTELGTVRPRKAGLSAPAYVDITDMSTTGSVVSNNAYVSYRAVFRKKEGTYTFEGAVSGGFTTQNFSGHNSIPSVTVYWVPSVPLAAGDQIELYRTEEQTDRDLLGDRHRFAVAYTITSTNITNSNATFLDTAVELGADLYYDGSQEGAAKNNQPPPPSTDVCTFKGATFYNAPTVAYQRTAAIPYGLGPLSSTAERTNGIGQRSVTGTWSATGTTITSVSNLVGLKVGQQVISVVPGVSGTITSVVGSTVTLNTAHTSSEAPGALFVYDVIAIDGVLVRIDNATSFLRSLAVQYPAGLTTTAAAPNFPVKEDLAVVETSASFTFSNLTTAFTLRATNGANYSPALPELTATVETATNDPRTNRLYFSKIDQPEAVSPDSFLTVRHGTILRMWATEESLFVACTDGISRIVGDGDDWAVVPFDEDTILLAPDAIDTMDNTAYALTTAGFVSITEKGVQKISGPLVGDDFRTLWKYFQSALPYTFALQVACDKYRNEVWINFNGTNASTADFQQTYVWNTETNTFTTQSTEQSIGVGYVPYHQSILLGPVTGSGTTSVVHLRKYSATDYMTANFEFNPVFGDDVGYLKQWIDVTLFFQLLQAVTIKPSFERTDYPAAYALSAGADVEEVCAVLQDYAYNKHCRFGATITPILASKHWTLLGLTFRYRLAAETLRA